MPLAENESVVLEYRWELNNVPAGTRKIVSDFIELDGKKAFRLGIRNDSGVSSFYLYVSNVRQLGVQVRCVFCTVKDETFALTKFGKKLSHVFRRNGVQFHFSQSDVIRYRLLLEDDWRYYDATFGHQRYRYELLDDRTGAQLWLAACNNVYTDVEFVVGDLIFPAHRAIVGGRSPFWEQYFKSNPAEGRIWIDDTTDGHLFELLLRFLYSGQLKTEPSQSLLRMAERYRIETLISLCRRAVVVNRIKEMQNLLDYLHTSPLLVQSQDISW